MTLAARSCLRCGQSVYPFTRTLRREYFPTRYYDAATGEQHACPGIDWSAPAWAAQMDQPAIRALMAPPRPTRPTRPKPSPRPASQRPRPDFAVEVPRLATD
jgi:hypothetical protein